MKSESCQAALYNWAGSYSRPRRNGVLTTVGGNGLQQQEFFQSLGGYCVLYFEQGSRGILYVNTNPLSETGLPI